MGEIEIKNWRIIDLIRLGTEYFKLKGIDEARLTIELMLCHVLKCRRVDLYVNFEKPLTKSEVEELRKMMRRRLLKEPLQYIIGKTEFMGLEFKLSPAVLIPRPETEFLVEKAIEILKKDLADRQSLKVLDIGTGSGNIAISLAKLIGDKISVVGIDISKEAIEISTENAKLNVVKNVEFIQFDLFSDKFVSEFENKFDLVVSNPPYIAVDEVENLQDEIKVFEPRHAITDGADGLSFYRRIAQIGKKIAKQNAFILLEIAYGKSEDVKKIFAQEDYKQIEVFKDYLGIERVVKIKIEK